MEHGPLASASPRPNVSQQLRESRPIHCLWPTLSQSHWPTFLVLQPPLQAGTWPCHLLGRSNTSQVAVGVWG